MFIHLILIFLLIARISYGSAKELTFSLINAETDSVISGYERLKGGFILDLKGLPTKRINLEAIPPDLKGKIDSIQFRFDGQNEIRSERIAPYAFAGNLFGDFNSWTPSVGSHKIATRIFLSSSRGQQKAHNYSTYFRIIDGHNPAEKVEYCPTLKEEITVNGFLNEWEDLREFAPLTIHPMDSSKRAKNRNHLYGSIAYFNDRLYFAFIIDDTKLVGHDFKDGDKIVSDDCVEIFIAHRPTDGVRNNFSVYYFLLGVNSNVKTRFGHIENNTFLWDVKAPDIAWHAYVRPLGTVNRMDDKDSGMVVEASISLSSLGLSPKNEKEVWVEIGNRDQDLKSSAYYRLSGDNKQLALKNWCRMVFEKSEEETKERKLHGRKKPFSNSIFLFLLLIVGQIFLVVFIIKKIRSKSKIRRQLKNELSISLNEYIEDNFKEDILLEKFCAKYHLTLRTTQDWIKKNMNTTFNHLLTKRRMKEAKNLLEGTDKTVAEICYKVGYNHTSYFASTFKKFYGISPSEAQALAKNK